MTALNCLGQDSAPYIYKFLNYYYCLYELLLVSVLLLLLRVSVTVSLLLNPHVKVDHTLRLRASVN